MEETNPISPKSMYIAHPDAQRSQNSQDSIIPESTECHNFMNIYSSLETTEKNLPYLIIWLNLKDIVFISDDFVSAVLRRWESGFGVVFW